MTSTSQTNPFHAGERAAQQRAGVGDVSQWAGGFVRDYLPEQHRQFHTALPFLVVSGGDAAGQVWATVIEGPDGFITSPDPQHLALRSAIPADDPLAERLRGGGDIGAVGIDLGSRRRNRFSGKISPTPEGSLIRMTQTFGNCPQYIHERSLRRVPGTPGTPVRGQQLTPDQIAQIRAADTLFIGSGQYGTRGEASDGYDASHRGGPPGFVQVVSPTRLLIPDYMGNNFFNTIGNIMADPRVGLLFIDFETGGLLHLSGRAHVDWDPRDTRDGDAWRMIELDIDSVIQRPAALSLRWARQAHLARRLKLTRKVQESAQITSFHLAPADGRPLDPFTPGQHLPITVQIPGQAGTTARSYSLSGPPGADTYRLSVKREAQGLVSRFLHDQVQTGAIIEAQSPSGDFVTEKVDAPLVLISAGVGLTPMLSMLHAAAAEGRQTWFLHGARNGCDHAHRAEVATLVDSHPHLHRRVFYSRPEARDVAGRDYDIAGRMSAADVRRLIPDPKARFMLCGPAGFVAQMQDELEQSGIPAAQIRFETF